MRFVASTAHAQLLWPAHSLDESLETWIGPQPRQLFIPAVLSDSEYAKMTRLEPILQPFERLFLALLEVVDPLLHRVIHMRISVVVDPPTIPKRLAARGR